MKLFKINTIPTILALALASLSSYAFFSYADTKEKATIVAIGAFIILFGTLFGMMGFSYEHKRNMTMVRVTSSIFFLISLISNIIFNSIEFKTPTYIIVNGLIVISYFLISYYIVKSAE